MNIASLMLISGKLCIISDFESLSHLKPKVSAVKQEDAAKDLFQRVLGARSEEFKVKIQADIGPKERDTFIVSCL